VFFYNKIGVLLSIIEPIRRLSLSDKIINQLIDLISIGKLKPGQRLSSERELCKQFGVGRSSLREALRSLAVMGILEGRVGEGTYIAKDSQSYLKKTAQWGLLFDPKNLNDLLETRLMLESQTSFLAAQRATGDDIENLKKTLDDLNDSADHPERYLELDLQFHLDIAQATQNSVLHNLLGMTRGYLKESIKDILIQSTLKKTKARMELSLHGHLEIFEAIRTGQAEKSRQVMIKHIQTSTKS
jgi:GntR family transcriptional repressor for pyruvate dehydrogenase complex